MEISARVLREVEFNSSLRGYNTDEVDEFLEQVADAVERLHEELKGLRERADAAEQGAKERTDTSDDDDSIRRTLVLAQRTADMAIREAKEEATQLVDRARSEAETMVSDARDSAQRISSEAERRLKDEVARLSGNREGLQKEIDTLVSLLGAERERLTETLTAALKYVERSLSPSPELLSANPSDRPSPASPPSPDGPGTSSGNGGGVTETAADGPAASREEAASAAAPSAEPTSAGAHAAAEPDEEEATADGETPGGVDDLELAIAEDAAVAAPSYGRRYEPEQYDWDSVMRSRPDPLFPDHGRAERPNLTGLPSLHDRSDSATMKSGTSGGDLPA